MSAATVGILCFAAMALMILAGLPLCVSMLTCSFAGLYIIGGAKMLVAQLTNGVFNLSASYMLAVIPLFMVMGMLSGDTGIAEGTFASMKKWLGTIRGGLLYSVVAANMIFGACSGMSSAGDVVFSRIALPELNRHGYDKGLSLGTITASGTLSVLIPPSIPIITFCLLTEVPIGAALVTGVSSGILFALLMFGMIAVYTRLHPEKIPPRDETKVPFREKVATLKLLAPIFCFFALIVGGSFAGWFPATTGGGIACCAVLIYALCKRMSLKTILKSVWNGLQGFGNVFVIVAGGQMFGRLVSMSGLAKTAVSFIETGHFAPYLVFTFVVIFYLFCGCFMDCLSIIIITVPIVYPMLSALGFHDLIIVMLLVFSCEVASLTPPVGVAVFHVANCTKESTGFIFKNVVKFFLLDLSIIFIIAAFPNLILWLPKLMGYL